jgi:hypothetical protein
MPEDLTESFCERCGTRYEFQAPTRLNPLRRGRGFVSGFKNYLLSQDALSDSIGDAMRAEEQDLASAQLEAFHAAFNFCINCRQYACNNCWNDADGRCRTCAPIPGTDDLVQRLEDAYRAERVRASGETADEPELDAAALQRRLGAEAWPSSDLAAEGVSGATPVPQEAPEEAPILAAEIAPLPEPPAGLPVLADATAPASEVVEPPLTAAAQVEFSPILGWEPDLSTEEQAAPFLESEPAPLPPTIPEAPPVGEPSVAPVAEEPAAPPLPIQPVVELPASAEAPTASPRPVAPPAEPRPTPAEPVPAEPVAAEAAPGTPVPPEEAPSPAPTPIRPRLTPLSETFVRRAPRPPRPAREPAPTDDAALAARRAQLELLGIEDPGEGRVSTGQRPALAYRSSGAAVHPSEVSARAAAGAGNAPSPLWDASSREVAAGLSAIAVQSCDSCGLSLSASARFCRRCGARQARSA